MTRLPFMRPPSYLTHDAGVLWREVVDYLRANGTLLSVDAGTIETYVLAVVRQRGLQAAIDADGVMIDGKPHPALRTIEATAATVKNLAHVLGLSPLARKALPAVRKTRKEKDPWAGVLK